MSIVVVLAQRLAQAEPAPAGWSATGEALVRHAEARPDIAFPLLAVISPLALIAGLVWVVVRFVLPAWREEKKLDREHQTSALKTIREDAAGDAAAVRELALAQNQALVARVETKVDRQTGEIEKISGRLDRHGEVLQRVAERVAERIPSKLALILLPWLSCGCGPSLPQQVQLRRLADAARTSCKSARADERQRLCNLARSCAKAALDGNRAIQANQKAKAAGAGTNTQAAAAQSLYDAGIDACAAGGWK